MLRSKFNVYILGTIKIIFSKGLYDDITMS